MGKSKEPGRKKTGAQVPPREGTPKKRKTLNPHALRPRPTMAPIPQPEEEDHEESSHEEEEEPSVSSDDSSSSASGVDSDAPSPSPNKSTSRKHTSYRRRSSGGGGAMAVTPAPVTSDEEEEPAQAQNVPPLAIVKCERCPGQVYPETTTPSAHHHFHREQDQQFWAFSREKKLGPKLNKRLKAAKKNGKPIWSLLPVGEERNEKFFNNFTFPTFNMTKAVVHFKKDPPAATTASTTLGTPTTTTRAGAGKKRKNKNQEDTEEPVAVVASTSTAVVTAVVPTKKLKTKAENATSSIFRQFEKDEEDNEVVGHSNSNGEDRNDEQKYFLGTVKIKLKLGVAKGKNPSFSYENVSEVFSNLATISIYSPVYNVVETRESRERSVAGDLTAPMQAIKRFFYTSRKSRNRPVPGRSHFTSYGDFNSSRPASEIVVVRRFIEFKTKEELKEELEYQAEVKGEGPVDKKYLPKGEGLYYYEIEGVDQAEEGFVDLDWFKGLSKQSIFRLELGDFEGETGILSLNVFLLHSIVIGDHDINDIPGQEFNSVPEILSRFLGVPPFHKFVGEAPKENIPWFFSQIKEFHDHEELVEPSLPFEGFQHPALLAKLRGYQRRAILWMLFREGVAQAEGEGVGCDLVELLLRRMYQPVQLLRADDTLLPAFFSPTLGYLCWQRPNMRPIPKVGILADEMGLGKTVEIISLILLHPRPPEELKIWRKGDAKPNPFSFEEDGEEVEFEMRKSDEYEKPMAKRVKVETGTSKGKGASTSTGDKNLGGFSDKEVYCNCFGKFTGTSQIIKCSVCCTYQHAVCVKFEKEWATQRENFKYVCSRCIGTQPPVISKTTLIITPYNITQQWIDEINVHVEDSKMHVLYYTGINKKYYPPELLASYDVVITPYDVLSSEISYLHEVVNKRKFRKPRKYGGIASPLPHVEWWRICLDEAQTIQGVESNMSKMAQVLITNQRWCVTGTPMIKGVEDLFGQFAFMSISPLAERRWWQLLICEPYYKRDMSIFYELFGQLIWRTEKKHISKEELDLPPQLVINHALEFSAVEAYFYKKEQQDSHEVIMEQIDSLIAERTLTDDTLLSEINRPTLQTMMLPFLRLRQACSHPQLVRELTNDEKFRIASKSVVYGLDEVLRQLQKHGEASVLSSLKVLFSKIISHVEKLFTAKSFKDTGTLLLKIVDTSNKFENALAKPCDKTIVAINTLLALHNSSYPYSLPSTKACSELRGDIKKWEKLYLNDVIKGRKREGELLPISRLPVDSFLDKHMEDEDEELLDWAVAIVEAADRSLGLSADLRNRLGEVMEKGNFPDSFETLKNKIPKFIDSLLAERKGLLRSVGKSLMSSTIESMNNRTLSNTVNELKEQLIKYKGLLLGKKQNSKTKSLIGISSPNGTEWGQLTEFEKRAILQQEEKKFGNEAVDVNERPSQMELWLRTILGFGKDHGTMGKVKPNIDALILKGESTMKLFKLMDKECRAIHSFIYALKAESTARLSWARMKEDTLPLPEVRERAVKIEKDAMMRGEAVIKEKERELDVVVGRLRYLQYLGNDNNNNDDERDHCPICFVEMLEEFNFFDCGHHFCIPCTSSIFPKARASFKCPTCRTTLKREAVHVVTSKSKAEKTQKTESSNGKGSAEPKAGPSSAATSSGAVSAPRRTRVIGEHSAKVDAIIETLLEIGDSYPGEKSLVFSQWQPFLDILEEALRMNKIPFCRYKTGAQCIKTLETFKSDPKILVLLLPTSVGSKGLNLTEATHVLLSEPNLNSASEKQAIGRVHRIGQTKKTFVHRFYMKSSIEEYLFETLTNKEEETTEDELGSLTVAELKHLVSIH